MNYGTLNRLNDILSGLKNDAVTVGFTIAGLMVAIYAIMIMFDQDTSPSAHIKRWENMRKVFVCAAIIAAIGAIISFSQQLGGGLN